MEVLPKARRTSFLPRKFFVTSGKASSPISMLNAFDLALKEAGISQCNLVRVSSVLPSDAVEVPNEEIDPGTITFCVLAHVEGVSNEVISAGIGWAFGTTADGKRYGIVAEAKGHKSGDKIKDELRRTLGEMARARGLKLEPISLRVESMEVPRRNYGSVVSALIYLPW